MKETSTNKFQDAPQLNRGLKNILLIVLFSFLFLVVLGLLDGIIITPLILPEDYCYYHTNDIPWWVELFYMNPASNGHPDGSFFHLLFLLIISALLGFLTAKRFVSKEK